VPPRPKAQAKPKAPAKPKSEPSNEQADVYSARLSDLEDRIMALEKALASQLGIVV
jgi:hypothetical protein